MEKFVRTEIVGVPGTPVVGLDVGPPVVGVVVGGDPVVTVTFCPLMTSVGAAGFDVSPLKPKEIWPPAGIVAL